MRLIDIVLDCLLGPLIADYHTLTMELVEHCPDALRIRGLTSLDGLIAAGRYDNTKNMKTLLRRFKFGRASLLSRPLGKVLADAINTSTLPRTNDVVLVPVPLFWARECDRGFNQSALLANVVSEVTRIPYMELLRRTRHTGRQALRTRRERLHALDGAFACTVQHVPRTIILIDDLSTTGATLEECALTLKRHGAKIVLGAVVAVG
ncbi:MAG: hypothetical protein ABL890_02485 [Candidatus Peribacteraceae bacterium]